ncbi:hypothetical protein [Roseibacillus persicicus]|uniref:hypothetical protein n=1 Tax=Roseibacillus persicicus TaxID=454148 RepID=UPI00281144D3|nr:hypothetical protein [Roseibacillus persicicus]
MVCSSSALLRGGIVLMSAIATGEGQTPLCPNMPSGPTIVDPTMASCIYDAANDAAVITLNGNAVLDWRRVRLTPESSLTFNFSSDTNGGTVLNRLAPLNLGRTHQFNGTLTSNGRVVILSPSSAVSLSGVITADELVAVVHEVNPAGEAALLQGNQAVDFAIDSTASSTSRLLTVSNARITSTGGDVVLGAARGVTIANTSSRPTTITSAEATRVFGGSRINYDPSKTTGEKITPLPGNENSFVSHSGTITAGSDVEIRASESSQLLITGPISANHGQGRIFLRVDDGRIDLNPNANLAGTLETTGTFASALFETNEGDTPGTSSPSVGLFPSLRKENATDRKSKRSEPVKVFQGAPVTASAEASRKSKPPSQANSRSELAKQNQGNKRALVQRSGFFGLRSSQAQEKKSR